MIVVNFTPVPRHHYRIGVPLAGNWQEIFNSDSTYYGGSNLGNPFTLTATDTPWMARPASVEVTLPPLGLIILKADA